MTDIYLEILELVEKQDEIISKQNKTINKIINELLEKENMLTEVLTKFNKN